jgi:hypothetical protein
MGGTNVGDIFNSKSAKIGLYSQFCGGTNVGHIFNSVAAKMWGTFSTLWLEKF